MPQFVPRELELMCGLTERVGEQLSERLVAIFARIVAEATEVGHCLNGVLGEVREIAVAAGSRHAWL